MSIVITHPTGNQNVRAAVEGLIDAGIRVSFNTTIATFPGSMMGYLSSSRPFEFLGRRQYSDRLRQVTNTTPWLEWGRLIALRSGLKRLTRHEYGPLSIDSVYRHLDKRVAKGLDSRTAEGYGSVYAYEDGAIHTFTKARTLGLNCFYDLPVGYWREARHVFENEKARWPQWATTLSGLQDSTEKLTRKDSEIHLADKIFVASQFTARTLRSFPGVVPPIEVIPYGFPAVGNPKDYSARADRRLKILFVGGLTQRKGLVYLFQAAEALRGHVKLTVVGSKPEVSCPPLNSALAKHDYLAGLSHRAVLETMRAHDVLVFPSLFEGFGLVITEAMSQGTPVITTERTAGPDLIDHGRNGWIIGAGSTEALIETLATLVEKRWMVSEAGKAAMETARLRPWSSYSKALVQAVQRGAKKNDNKTAYEPICV